MKNKICCIFNIAPHYRDSIYKLMDKALECDFYFGDKVKGNTIVPMRYDLLVGFKNILVNNIIFGNFFIQRGVINILIKKKYNKFIIDGEPFNISNWIVLIYGKISHKKVYTWTHGWYGRESYLKKLTKKLFFNLAYHNFLYGEYAKQLMINEGIDENKLSCIYNSLNYDEQVLLRNNSTSSIYFEHFLNNHFNLIFIGRLTIGKKLDYIISVMEVLRNKGIQVNVTFIGDGDLKNRLVALSKKLNLEKNIWFYGACYNESELSKLIYNADICVSPGNVGLTAIHAMSYGLPVITHNDFKTQGPEFEVIESKNTGLFFEKDNLNSLAEAVTCWINLKKDRDITRNNCYSVIDKKYNPHFQIKLLTNKLT